VTLLCYDEIWLREPRLMVPRQQPLGPIKLLPEYASICKTFIIGTSRVDVRNNEPLVIASGVSSVVANNATCYSNNDSSSATINSSWIPTSTLANGFVWLMVGRQLDTSNSSVIGMSNSSNRRFYLGRGSAGNVLYVGYHTTNSAVIPVPSPVDWNGRFAIALGCPANGNVYAYTARGEKTSSIVASTYTSRGDLMRWTTYSDGAFLLNAAFETIQLYESNMITDEFIYRLFDDCYHMVIPA